MPAAKPKKENDASEVPKEFDVAKPGKTPATATSRPVIVGHGSTTRQDPMMNAPEESTKENSETQSIQTHGKTLLTPMENQDNPEQPEASPSVGSEAEKAPEAAVPAGLESSDTATLDAVANEANAKKEEHQEVDKNAARVLELEKIVDSKQYVVPIGEASRSRSNRRALIALVLMLIVIIAGINFASDAEMIEIGVKPLTDIL